MKSNELKAELKRCELTYDDASSFLGISRLAFQRKINGETEFKAGEIKQLIKLLKLNDEGVMRIFFSSKVS